MKYKPRELTGKQYKCIELLVYTNMTHLQICKEIGVSKNTISTWLGKEKFQEELRKETDKSLNGLAQKAVRRLGELVDSNNQIVALSACKEILNKSGYQETQKIEQTNRNIEIEIEE